MSAVSQRAGLYLALLQLIFTLCWTVYVIYLPKLAATAGLPRGAVIVMLMLDQAIFTVVDFATGIATDRASKVLGRIGYWAAVATLLSCIAFIALPFVAPAGSMLLIGCTLLWAITSSALRAPPLMLLGKYAAKPSIPWLSALAMVGYGLAGAAGPYLAVALRDVDPRLPFALASVALVLTTFGLAGIERMLARQGAPQKRAARPFGTLRKPAVIFGLMLVLLALGYQLHFAINSAPIFLRFAKPSDLEWLMPVFWIGFNIAMFPAAAVTNRFGAYLVMGASAFLGAIAIVVSALANSLELLTVAQFAAGGAWGCILMSAFTLAFAIGEDGAEGGMTGLLFSALALATFTRMAVAGAGLAADAAFKPVLQWAPTVCWLFAGVALLYLAATGLRGMVKRVTPSG